MNEVATRDVGRWRFIAKAGIRWVLPLLAVVLAMALTYRHELKAEEKAPQQPIARPERIEAVEVIYDGKLGGNWQDWGWGPHELGHGAAQLNMSNYGGWILWNPKMPQQFGGLVFRLRAPASFGSFLQVHLLEPGKSQPTLPGVDIGPEHMKALPDGWVEVYVPWNLLDPGQIPFDRVQIHARIPVSSEPVQFDKVVLTRFDPAAARVARTEAPGRRVPLAVDCKAPGKPISPYIYGLVGGGEEALGLKPTAQRWGGNPTSRYNWQAKVTNAGSDWFFENRDGGDSLKVMEEHQKRGQFFALTVPAVGWVAKDSGSSGFPVSVYGAQQATDQWRPDAGNGLHQDGSPIKPGSPTVSSVPAPPQFIAGWVQSLKKRAQETRGPGVQMYFIDNEPSLWSSTHRDVHPDPLTYDELLDRTIRYGTAIRSADPQARIAGPAEWGWSAYFFSAKDLAAGSSVGPDRRAHGDIPLVPWYLQQLAAHEKQTGQRLLDVLDLHYYPQGKGIFSGASDPATAALRIRSTRSLWDPTYKDESWINDRVQLIPRMKEWVAQNYPGLKTSLGEYNFGGEGHISGALALAEALGRFGTTGLDYAFYWTTPPENSPAFWAFRAYRNFDGKGARFLDRSLATRMDPEVSLFASADDSGKHLVLIALNLDSAQSADTSIALEGCGTLSSRRKFTFDQFSTALENGGEKTGAAFAERLAPYSINVFDLTMQ